MPSVITNIIVFSGYQGQYTCYILNIFRDLFKIALDHYAITGNAFGKKPFSSGALKYSRFELDFEKYAGRKILFETFYSKCKVPEFQGNYIAFYENENPKSNIPTITRIAKNKIQYIDLGCIKEDIYDKAKQLMGGFNEQDKWYKSVRSTVIAILVKHYHTYTI
jgi:hypothetical protein